MRNSGRRIEFHFYARPAFHSVATLPASGLGRPVSRQDAILPVTNIAQYPDADDRVIKGLKSKADIDDWLNGTRRVDWLRSQGTRSSSLNASLPLCSRAGVICFKLAPSRINSNMYSNCRLYLRHAPLV